MSDLIMRQLLKPPDVAKHLNISRTAAYRLLAAGEIPSVRFGGSVRVDPLDLERYIQEHKTHGETSTRRGQHLQA